MKSTTIGSPAGDAGRRAAPRGASRRAGPRGAPTPRAAAAIVLTLQAVWSAAGCSPPPPPEAPAPAGVALAYALPPTPGVRYTMADTVEMTVQGAGMAAMRISGSYFASVDMDFGASAPGSGVQITATVADFSGRFSNPQAGTISANESDIRGPWILRVDPRGAAEIIREPEVTEAFTAVVGSRNLFRNFFIRLPEAPVTPGASWTDTIRVEEVSEDLEVSSTVVVTSTWAADTVLAGRTLRVITSRAENAISIRGSSEGQTIQQELAGPTRATTLFDPERSLMVWSRETGRLEGTLNLPAGGVTGLPISASISRNIGLGSR